MATCEKCLHYDVCYKSQKQEKLNVKCGNFASHSKYVVREKGEWESISGLAYICNRCRRGGYLIKHNFCPHCGADMRKEAVE